MRRAKGIYEVWCRETQAMTYSYWNGEHWNGPWSIPQYVDISDSCTKTPWAVYKVGKCLGTKDKSPSPSRRLLVLLCKR